MRIQLITQHLQLRLVGKPRGDQRTFGLVPQFQIIIDAKIKSVLEKVGLKGQENKMTYEMSGGEQQRVDIARALLNNPKLILADEPTGNLDPDTADEIMYLLHSICLDYGSAIIMATHDYNIIQKFRSRVVRTEHGLVNDHAMVV